MALARGDVLWVVCLRVSPAWRERPYYLTIFDAQYSTAIYALEGDTFTRVQWCERERAWLFHYRNCSASILPTVDYRPRFSTSVLTAPTRRIHVLTQHDVLTQLGEMPRSRRLARRHFLTAASPSLLPPS